MAAIVSRLWMMSLQASILILIVLAARFFLRKYPKGYSYFLWAIVGLRLLCPVWVEIPAGMEVYLPNVSDTFEQMLAADEEKMGENSWNYGMQPEANDELDQIQQWVQNNNGESNQIQQSVENTNDESNQIQQSAQMTGNVQKQSAQNNTNIHNVGTGEQENRPEREGSSLFIEEGGIFRIPVLAKILTVLYLTGVVILAVIYLVQFWMLKKRVSTAVLAKNNVWFSENISTPFVMGVFRPQIYLPYGLDKVSKRYILKHEKTHIKHHDPIIRIIGILCLCLHWWNPLVWLAVYQMNQDMEMYCDEGFLLRAPLAERKAYANVLLAFAEKRSGLWVELAFGESHTEQRVKNILYRKKKSTACIVVVVLVMLLSGCSFLAESSNTANQENMTEEESVQKQDTVSEDETSTADSGEDLQEPNSSDMMQTEVEENPSREQKTIIPFVEGLTEEVPVTPSPDISIAEIMEQIEGLVSEAEEKAAELTEELQNAITQADMNVVSGEIYETWDTALNSIWNILNENLDGKSRDLLLAEQLKWIAEKEAAVQAAGEEYGGGSLAILVSNKKAAELTRERVYELAKYLQ